jgi:hypothetical protein
MQGNVGCGGRGRVIASFVAGVFNKCVMVLASLVNVLYFLYL